MKMPVGSLCYSLPCLHVASRYMMIISLSKLLRQISFNSVHIYAVQEAVQLEIFSKCNYSRYVHRERSLALEKLIVAF